MSILLIAALVGSALVLLGLLLCLPILVGLSLDRARRPHPDRQQQPDDERSDRATGVDQSSPS